MTKRESTPLELVQKSWTNSQVTVNVNRQRHGVVQISAYPVADEKEVTIGAAITASIEVRCSATYDGTTMLGGSHEQRL
jgi:hypothetical protein